MGTRGRFLKHTMGNLKEFKVTEEMLVAADEKAKAESLKKTGRTWSNMQYYTRNEDEEILEYIVEKQQFSRVAGEALFKEMAAEKAVEGRNWKSLQHRFRRHIRNNLQSYDTLTEQQRTFLRERTVVLDEEGNLAAGQTMHRQKFSVTEEKAILDFIVGKKAYARLGSRALFKEMVAEGVVQGRDWVSLFDHFRKHIIKAIDSYGLTKEQVSAFKNKTIIKDADGQIAAGQIVKNQRYSGAENEMIVHYIARKKAYNKVGRDQLWKKMEKSKIVGDRTWASMKLRFYRTLIKNIEKKSNTYNLDDEQVSLFIHRGEIEDGGEEEEESSDEEGEGEGGEEVDEDEKVDEDTSGVDEPGMQEGGEMEVEDDMEDDEADREDEEEEDVEEHHIARIQVDFE